MYTVLSTGCRRKTTKNGHSIYTGTKRIDRNGRLCGAKADEFFIPFQQMYSYQHFGCNLPPLFRYFQPLLLNSNEALTPQ